MSMLERHEAEMTASAAIFSSLSLHCNQVDLTITILHVVNFSFFAETGCLPFALFLSFKHTDGPGLTIRDNVKLANLGNFFRCIKSVKGIEILNNNELHSLAGFPTVKQLHNLQISNNGVSSNSSTFFSNFVSFDNAAVHARFLMHFKFFFLWSLHDFCQAIHIFAGCWQQSSCGHYVVFIYDHVTSPCILLCVLGYIKSGGTGHVEFVHP